MTANLPSWNTADVDALDSFASLKLIALDADGTLLNASFDVLAPRIAMLRRSLTRVGQDLKIMVATGRALSGAYPILRALNGSNDVPAILYNGAVTVHPFSGHLLQVQTIPRDAVMMLFAIAERLQMPLTTYTVGRDLLGARPSYIDEDSYGLQAHFSHEAVEFNGLRVNTLSTTSAYPDSATVAALLDIRLNSEKGPRALEALAAIAAISVTRSGNSYIEIRPANVNKGRALENLAKTMCVSPNEVLALGDNDNDVEMLRWAGIGVAVGGGSAAAIANADYVSEYGAVSAAIEVLQIVRVAKRYSRGYPLKQMRRNLQQWPMNFGRDNSNPPSAASKNDSSQS